MSILYSKTATLYKYSTNENNVSSYSTTWASFACSIQPVGAKDWLEWIDFLKTRKMYSDKEVEVWDKIVADWVTYIVDSVLLWNGLRRKFYKSFIVESNGN